MRAFVFAPYGTGSNLDEESGGGSEFSACISFLHLLLSYLRSGNLDIVKIICNGCAPFCAYDLVSNKQKKCASCHKQQETLAGWANLKQILLTDYSSGDPLPDYYVQNRTDLLEKFGITPEHPERKAAGKTIDLVFRSLTKIHKQLKPDLIFLANTNDLYVQAVKTICELRGIKTVSVDYSADQQILMTKNYTLEKLNLPVYLESLERVRPANDSWPSEIQKSVQTAAKFLDFSVNQLTLGLTKLR